MARNIQIVYLIAFLNRCWFWTAIWIFFYLKFTNYGGIGLIESLMIVISVILEIPTGAIADLIGKQKTLLISMVFWTVANIVMGFSVNFFTLMSAAFIASIGAAFYSGSFEAIIFDSLKQMNQDNRYEKVISRTNTLDLIAMALSSIVGGYLYAIDPRWPFLFTAVASGTAIVATIFLEEPKVDSEKFSLKIFLNQNQQGLKALFSRASHRAIVFFFLPIIAVYIFGYQFLQDAINVQLGFSTNELGIIIALIGLTAAFFSYLTPHITQLMSFWKFTLLAGAITSIVFISIAFLPPVIAIAISLIRIGLLTNVANLVSTKINSLSTSQNRATTLSTFNLIANLPYVFMATLMGKAIEATSALHVARLMGFLVVIIVLFQVLLVLYNRSYFTENISAKR